MPNPRAVGARLSALLLAILVCSALGLVRAQDSTTLIGVAEASPNFSTLLNALERAGLTETLESPGPYTVFAPTNDAFAKLSDSELSALLADSEALRRVLDYHIVPGSFTTSEITASVRETGFTTLLGDILPITESGVGNATVTTVNLPASNGVLFAIDTVLTPPAAPVVEEPETDTPETDTPETVLPPTGDDTRTRFAVDDLTGSGVAGSVLVAEFAGDRTIVTLSLTGTLPGSEHPAALYAGSCAALGAAPVTDLEPFVSDLGFSTTVAALPYQTLTLEPHAVAVQASPSDPTVVACGEVGQ